MNDYEDKEKLLIDWAVNEFLKFMQNLKCTLDLEVLAATYQPYFV